MSLGTPTKPIECQMCIEGRGVICDYLTKSTADGIKLVSGWLAESAIESPGDRIPKALDLGVSEVEIKVETLASTLGRMGCWLDKQEIRYNIDELTGN